MDTKITKKNEKEKLEKTIQHQERYQKHVQEKWKQRKNWTKGKKWSREEEGEDDEEGGGGEERVGRKNKEKHSQTKHTSSKHYAGMIET
jgi:hypothetical protein